MRRPLCTAQAVRYNGAETVFAPGRIPLSVRRKDMPELPEVETVRQGLAAAMTGLRLQEVTLRRADLRLPFPDGFSPSVTGRRVMGLRRRAKYLLMDLDNGLTVIMHLGMSGRFTILPPEAQPAWPSLGPHDHVVFDLEDGARVVYADPRRFGLMTLCARARLDSHPLLAHLGAEPLGASFTADYLSAALRRRRTAIKSALLDQKIVVGIGNIYACEALFQARISPRRSSHTVPGRRAGRLVDAIRAVLEAALAAGGSSLRDYARTDGELGYFQHSFAVYDRAGAPCPRPGCSGTIRRLAQGGRSSFYCPACQR